MVRAVSAFIDFFNSSGCEGITFGEMKHFLEEVLDSTLQELSNVKQLDQISSFDKLKGQATLRRHRCQGSLSTLFDLNLTSAYRYSWWIKYSLCNFWSGAVKFIARPIH